MSHVTKPGELAKDLGLEPDDLLYDLGMARHKLKIAMKALKRIAPADNAVARWAKRALRDIEIFEKESNNAKT